MNQDLKIIKKKYGEEMMRFCRDAFSSILEEEGLLSNLLLDHFEPTHELYNDLINYELTNSFKSYIFSLTDIKEEINNSMKTPEELLDEAGYILYECKTEEDIQQFKKYYAKGEALCTFNGGRLNLCRVFFAVKKNVDEIKREDYLNPQRQDEYGTSVISIQFTNDGTNTISIKNRYNHNVKNPDATFSNNLDNIIPGLTNSFEKYYDIKQRYKSGGFEIPNYVLANDGKYYKYNYELGNIYYCPNNIIIDNFKVKRLEKEKYIVMDYFILDLQNKKIDIYNGTSYTYNDGFFTGLNDIKDIRIEKNNDRKTIYITPDSVENPEIIEIELDKDNIIVGYKNNNIIYANELFLQYNEKLEKIELNRLRVIYENFLWRNKELTKISLPNVQYIGNRFLKVNLNLQEIDLPNVTHIGDHFLSCNNKLIRFNAPLLEFLGEFSLCNNKTLKEINVPNLLKYANIAILTLNHNIKIFEIVQKNLERKRG